MSYSTNAGRRRKFDISLREYFTQLWHDRVSGLSIRFTLFFFVVFLLILGFFYWRLPPEIPLTYSRPWGNDQLVAKPFLFVLLSLTLLIVVVNSLLASFLYAREQLLARMLVWVSALIVFLVDITVLRVVILIS